MSVHGFVHYQISYAIGLVILAGLLSLRTRMWLRRAHTLALRSDIALPRPLAGRVARLLRNEYLFGQLALVLTVPSLSFAVPGLEAQRNWATWFPPVLAGLPLSFAVIFFVFSLWPRWQASGEYRVTHLDRLPIRQAFTPAELTAVISGAVLTAALGAWGLWYVAAPAIWWLAWAATLAVAFAAWRYTANMLMNRPSSASDVLELGWDDLLRFRQVRGMTTTAAWMTAAYVYVIDGLMSSAFDQKTTMPDGGGSYSVRWLPVAVPIAVAGLLAGVFRQGRQLWRRAWLERG